MGSLKILRYDDLVKLTEAKAHDLFYSKSLVVKTWAQSLAAFKGSSFDPVRNIRLVLFFSFIFINYT